MARLFFRFLAHNDQLLGILIGFRPIKTGQRFDDIQSCLGKKPAQFAEFIGSLFMQFSLSVVELKVGRSTLLFLIIGALLCEFMASNITREASVVLAQVQMLRVGVKEKNLSYIAVIFTHVAERPRSATGAARPPKAMTLYGQ
ncbi:MAG: hypothetical protein V1929_10365 [bacterium]